MREILLPVVVQLALVAAALASPLLLDLHRSRCSASDTVLATPLRIGRPEWPVLITVAALIVLAVIGLATVGNRPIGTLETDAWHLWTRRALLLVSSPHLPTAIFSFSGDVRY